VLVVLENHRDVGVAHDVGHGVDVRSGIQGVGGEGVAQVVWPDAPGDSRALKGFVPGLLDAGYGLALVGDDVFLPFQLVL